MNGPWELDVLAERLQAEYGLRVTFEPSRFEFALWIAAKSPAERDGFIHAHPASMARDLDGAPVFLASSAFDLKYEHDNWPEIVFSDIKKTTCFRRRLLSHESDLNVFANSKESPAARSSSIIRILS
jgi:peptide subunit release factor RF-3